MTSTTGTTSPGKTPKIEKVHSHLGYRVTIPINRPPYDNIVLTLDRVCDPEDWVRHLRAAADALEEYAKTSPSHPD